MFEYLQASSQERAAIKRDGHYIGTLMLTLFVAMNFTFSVVSVFLLLFGVIDPQMITHTYFGLTNTQYLLLYAAVYAFVFLAPTVVVSLCFRRHPLPLLPHNRFSPTVGFLSVIGSVGACVLISITVSIAMSYLEAFGVPMPQFPSLLENTPTSYFLNVIVIAVLPALLEEMLFRGAVLRTLRPYGDGFAIAISALLFGLMHGNIVQIPFACVVGIVLGWLYVSTDNIWLPIAVHFANNALSVSMEYASMQLSGMGQKVFSLLVYAMVVAVGIAAMLILAATNRGMFRVPSSRSVLSLPDKCKTFASSPVLIVALVAYGLLLIVGIF